MDRKRFLEASPAAAISADVSPQLADVKNALEFESKDYFVVSESCETGGICQSRAMLVRTCDLYIILPKCGGKSTSLLRHGIKVPARAVGQLPNASVVRIRSLDRSDPKFYAYTIEKPVFIRRGDWMIVVPASA